MSQKGLTQVEIAAHLDMSERNAREVLKKLEIDHRQATLEEIRVAYIRYLRELASGRGGEDQYDLTKQKARQAEADANLKEFEFWTKMRAFVPAEEAERLMSSWATSTRSEFENAVERVLIHIERQHGIEIDRGPIGELLEAAFAAVADYPRYAEIGGDTGGEAFTASA